MLRPRLRRLKPDEVHGIRHWTIELVVVVVGVLLALWAAEWGEDRRMAAELEDYEIALRQELQSNYVKAITHEIFVGCYTEFSLGLEALLLKEGSDWPGSGTRFERDDLNETGLTYGITGVLPRYLQTDMWEAAKQSGVLTGMPLERLSAYQRAYGGMAFINSGVARIEQMRDSLSGLVHPHQISPHTRTEALRDLANFNNGIQRLDNRERMDDVLIELGVQVQRSTLESMEDRLKGNREGLKDCGLLQTINPALIDDTSD
jgi:hypothetical protein